MRADQIINVDEGKVALRQVELPDPGDGQLLIKTIVSAISPGTERAFCLGLADTPRKWPSPIGYSLIGEVVAVGPGVEIKPGARVHAPEGHASAVISHLDRITPLPDAISVDDASFITMLEIALQAVRKARIEIGETVLVMGGGIIGQFAAQFAYVAGAGRVLLADVAELRLEIAARCGFAEPVNPLKAEGKRIIEGAGSRGGPEVVIEATGSPAPILDALKFAGHMGRVVLLASTRGSAEQVNFYRDVHRRGITIIGAHNAIRPRQDDSPGLWTTRSDAAASVCLLAAGRLNVSPVITDRFDASDFQAAYGRMFKWDEGLVGCVLRWSSARG